jgi:hypothetical protein
MSALFIMPIATIFTSLPAFADGYFDGLSTQDKYKFYVYARALNRCFQRAGKSAPESSIEDLRKGKIWSKGVPAAYIGTFPGFAGYNSSGGYFDCNSPDLINAAISQFNIQPRGRASAVEVLLCEVGYRRGGDYNKSAEDCINGSGKFGKKSNGTTGKDERSNEVEIYSEGKIFQALAHLSGYRTGAENSNPGIKYLVSRSMIKGCIKDDNPQPQRHDSKEWEIPNIDSSGNLSNLYYLPGDGQGYNVGGSNNREWPQNHYDSNIPEWQCMNIHKRLVESAPKYRQSLQQSAEDAACAGLAGNELKACQDGAKNRNNPNYCTENYSGATLSACQKGQTAKVDVPTEEGGDGEEKNSCGIDGIGWLVCPLINFMASINDAAYGAVSGFLDIKPTILDNPNGGRTGTRQGWEFFRDIANALFAVVFLWVIFSQISNVGLSNYGIKKILPRLIIGAVLVNISYYICQIAVDLSNILGYSLKEMLETAAKSIGTSSGEVGGWGIFSYVLAGTGAIIFILLAVGIPTILAGFLAILMVFIILIARQAGVILLVAISPVAFAAWLLPNTEGLFKQWMKMFRGLLLVFPVVSLLYGAGKLAAAILSSSATSDPNNPAETMQVAALGAATMPLLATPFVLQNALSSLGSIGGKIGKLSSLANRRVGSTVVNKSRVGDLKNKWKLRSAKKLADRRSGNTWLGRKADSLRGSDNWLAQKAGIALNPRRAFDSSAAGRFFGLSEGVNAAQEASDKFAREEAQRSFIYEHNGDAVAALKSKNKHVQKIAAEELAKKGEWGATQMAQYLEGGGKITSIGMADALTTMKGAHAGVSEAGTEALRQMQAKNGPSEVGFSPGKLSEFAASGVGKLSGEAIAKQSANAINSSKLSPEQASRILDNERLRSTMSKSTEEALQSIADTLKTSQENKNSRTENTPPANNEGSGLFIAHSQDDIRKAVEEQTKRQNRP